VLKYALLQTGKKYVLGGIGPNNFDCSGLVQTAWKKAGIVLPRVSGDQFKATIHISIADALPGDLVFYGQSGKQHVAIYLGIGLIVEAANSRKGVIISAIDEPWHHLNFGGIGRVQKPH
jgi:cell wall-associated NlpC family hydrolase